MWLVNKNIFNDTYEVIKMTKQNHKLLIYIFCFFIFLFNRDAILAASSEGNRIADMGAQLAVGVDSFYYAAHPWTRVYNNQTKKYVDIRERVSPVGLGADKGEYADCAVGVSTIVRASGVDPDFPTYLCPDQWNYLKGDGAKKWRHVGTYYIGTPPTQLQPGDVLLVDPTKTNASQHIWVYLGNLVVRKYWPNSDADSIQASWCSGYMCSFYPSLFKTAISQDPGNRPYAIFRFKGTDFVKGVQKWAEQVSTEKFEYQAADACNIISQELATYINRFFFYICVGGIILLVVLSSLNLIKVIVGHDNDGLYEFLQNLKVRIICLVVLLVLPVIIPYLLNTINNIAPIVGYNSDNPLCTSSSN